MNKIFSKVLSLVVAVAIMGSLSVGCTNGSTTGGQSGASTSSAPSASSAPSTSSESSASSYSLPITNTPITLKYWASLDGNSVAAGIKNLSESLWMKEAEKRTGINIQFIHPALGQESTQFNLMVASGDLPDIIHWNFLGGYTGGPEKAIEDGVIIDHTELLNKYAYNFNQFLKAFPEVEQYYKTDSGKTYNLPAFCMLAPAGKQDNGWENREPYFEAVAGPVLRADWLKDLGLSAPTSIDEWYNALKAFKDKKQATSPLTFQFNMWKYSNCFITAYNTTFGFYDDGNKKVLYGPVQPEYKQFLTTMAQWYNEGLLDPDFATNDAKAVDAKVLGGKAGAWVGYSGGGVGSYVQALQKLDPNYDVVGTVYPSLKSGETAEMGNKAYPYSVANASSISADNKHPVESIKFLDYFYSNEGDMLSNWGVEGVSYNVVNGVPEFSELISKDPAGLPAQQAMMKYIAWANVGNSSDFANRLALYKTYGANAEKATKDAKVLWGKSKRPADLPPVTISSDKVNVYAKIMSDINIYMSEQFMKFVTGAQSLDAFDDYVAQLKKMGIDSAVKIQQEALDRYYKR